ncbi:MAG TPA: pseudouridine-5'-phosphate glycosidase [Kofleriaceae bacterium]|nr:pseudouridine-5'-phosphate glycosidase [Kofleriaceae bacterium]
MIAVSEEVRDALASNLPVVALESTLIAHGLPFPQNLETAHELEAAVRAGGAVPATVAVVEGVARIGLDAPTLERLARPGAGVAKAGAADLAALAVQHRDAATTVSATCALAARAGIKLFATGGIGGVHQGDPSDVSSDLYTLARTPIAVVSSGAKAILDLRRTLETLETFGVLVIGYKTDDFPAFYSRSSGLPIEHRMYRPVDVAQALMTRFGLRQGGVLIANPVPPEAEISAEQIAQWIDVAHADAERVGVRGKDLTPFLLARLAGLSGGRTVAANRALALSNAQLASQIAAALALEVTTAVHPRLDQDEP